MKNKLLRFIMMISNLTLRVAVVQFLFMTMAFGFDGKAQENISVKQVTINVGFKNAELSDVLTTIEKETGYTFIYDAKDVNNEPRFTVNAKRRTVADLLIEISKNYNIQFKQVNNSISIKKRSNRYPVNEDPVKIVIDGVEITGRIISSEDGEALPGVNVVVKGTSEGTITDMDGRYRITVPNEESILVFSYVGFTSEEVVVGSRTVIDLSLIPDVEQLSEIVVIGYGEMKKADLTSAQVSVSSDQIEKTVNTTIEQAIQGRAAGVYVTQNSGQPGGGISVNIRGISSISGSNEPLYVIDGVQYQQNDIVSYGSSSSSNPIAGLNPSDIESIEILQGPSATAIYGSRATNGVVMITTKRGKKGETKVNYNFLYSLQDKPENQPVMNLPQYAEMYYIIRTINGGEGPDEFSNPSLLGPGTNWQNELFKTAALQKHQLSLSGGNDNTTFYLSGEHFDQDGVALGSGFTRSSVRLNLDNKVKDWLKISANLNYNTTEEKLTSTSQNVINNALSIAPNIPVKNPDGSWGGADDANGNSVQFTPLNPVAIANLTQNDLKRNTFLGGINLDITPIEGLLLRTSLNTSIGNTRQEFFIPTYRLGSRVNDVASLSVNSSNNSYWNLNLLAQYSRTFGDHNVQIMASHEAQESSWKNLNGQRNDFVTNEIPDLNIGDAASSVANGGQGDWAQESYFGRLNYNFKEKYYLQAAFRADGSVRFGPEKKWGYFPSGSVAWRLSEESFMDNISWLDELKLRFETGITGNQGGISYFGPLNPSVTKWGTGFRLGRYSNPELGWEETITFNVGFNFNVLDNRVQLEGDVYLKQTDNLLMEAPLPYYLGTSGEGSIAPPAINVGSLENKGLAISLHTINIDRNGFTWSMDANFSMFETKLTAIYEGGEFLTRRPWYVGDTGSGNNWEQRAAVGMAPWLFRGYIYDGLFQSQEEIENSAVPVNNNGDPLPADFDNVWVGDVKFKDLNGDGVITEDDKTDIGNPWPKATFGWTNTLSWKGFDLSILLTGVYGNDVFNLLRYNNTNPNNINLGRNLLLETFDFARVTGEGSEARLENPDTHIPRISPNSVNGNRLRFTDQFVEDGSYVRVKNVSLTYNLPPKLLNAQNIIQGVRLTVGAQNIYTWTNYSGYDPEIGLYVGSNAASDNAPIGLDIGRYPATPIYTFSIGVDF